MKRLLARAFVVGLSLWAICLQAPRTEALEHFAFEGPYLVDPGHTIKDHCLFRWGGVWHCFYIRGEIGAGTAGEDELGHAISEDLQTWEILPPAITAGPDTWDQRNTWAPMVLDQDPRGFGQRLMLYTGADNSVNQRMGFATSTDPNLLTWTKDTGNPILQPDPVDYFWDENGTFSAFRDPFYFFHDGKHRVLHTAKIPDATLGGGSRGVVHHASSSDFLTWTEEPPLFVHNGQFTAWHEIESVQLHQAVGHWFLFFSETNEEGVRFMRSTEYDSGFDINATFIFDFGIAPEVTPVTPERRIFTRHARAFHNNEGGWPGPETEFWVLRVDSLRYDDAVNLPIKVKLDPLAADWPVKTGTSFISAPTFGDNSKERGEDPTNPTGHGYISSKEFYGGPLSNQGLPGSNLGGGATGTMKSRAFVLSGDQMELRVGGGLDPNCFVALVSSANDSILFSATGTGSPALSDVVWDISGLAGQMAYLWIEDASTAPDGYINVDEIRETMIPSNTGLLPTLALGQLLPNVPNPFNPATQIRFELAVAGNVSLTLFDARGRRVFGFPATARVQGSHSILWNGHDDRGKSVSSGVYNAVLELDGAEIDRRPITLVR